MPFHRKPVRTIAGLALATSALSLSGGVLAQDNYPAPMSQAEIDALPPEYQSAPAQPVEFTETTIGSDGVETVTRTRRIDATPSTEQYYRQGYGYAQQSYGAVPATGGSFYTHGYSYAPMHYAAQPVVFEREQWLAECNRRTSGRSEKEKGGIIGFLLGALTGGIIGNRVADGDRLAGTLIGAGTGGIAGLALGSLIGGGKKDDRYDCEAALDGYMNQYGSQPARIASRTIPAPAYGYPGYAYAPPAYYGYGYAPAMPAYGYAAPQQVVLIPIEYQQEQRVVVRETVREELVPVEGASRQIPSEPMVAQPPVRVTPKPAPAPRQIKSIKN